MDSNVFVEREIANVDAKLQIIGKKFQNSEKSQNNATNGFKEISSNGVITGQASTKCKRNGSHKIWVSSVAEPPDFLFNLKQSPVREQRFLKTLNN